MIIEHTHPHPDSLDIRESGVHKMRDIDKLYLSSIDEILDFEPVRYPVSFNSLTDY